MISRRLLFAIAIAAVSTQPGWAVFLNDQRDRLPATSAIADGSPTLAPLPFVRFCMTNPNECHANGSGGLVTLDIKKWQALNDVNTAVNARILPKAVAEDRDGWSLTASNGDCNDYAVQKRHELLAASWPSSALLLAVVTTPNGKGHLVLTVRTDRGDLVLDNLRTSVFAWNDSDYRWVKRQSAQQPRHWVKIKATAAPRHRAN